MITPFSIEQTGQYFGTLDVGFLRPLRSAGKQHDDLSAALREIDAPRRAPMYPQFRFKHLYVRNFLGANYFVILEQQGVITSLLPALPHVYFPGSWTAAPERITVGRKTRLLCQTESEKTAISTGRA
jgi:hypothetical protein